MANHKSRSNNIIKNIKRFDASDPTPPQLTKMSQAFLYHSATPPIWRLILEQEGHVMNPTGDGTVLDDIGTLTSDVFTPASNPTKEDLVVLAMNRNLRQYMKNVLVAHELLTTNTPNQPVEQARKTVITNALVNGTEIVGDDADDPES